MGYSLVHPPVKPHVIITVGLYKRGYVDFENCYCGSPKPTIEASTSGDVNAWTPSHIPMVIPTLPHGGRGGALHRTPVLVVNERPNIKPQVSDSFIVIIIILYRAVKAASKQTLLSLVIANQRSYPILNLWDSRSDWRLHSIIACSVYNSVLQQFRPSGACGSDRLWSEWRLVKLSYFRMDCLPQ